VAGALALHQEELTVYEQLGDVRSRAVTQYDLGNLRRALGQADEAEVLFQAGLATSREIQDVEGIAVFLMALGRLALERGDREGALPLLEEARQRFVALGFPHWVESVESLLAQAQQGRQLTLEMIVSLVRAARAGDEAAGQQAWQIGEGLTKAPDEGYRALGRALQALLVGEAPETALRDLPADLRAAVEELLHD
jgi:tetratricopeptide (TPR) repeat protein